MKINVAYELIILCLVGFALVYAFRSQLLDWAFRHFDQIGKTVGFLVNVWIGWNLCLLWYQPHHWRMLAAVAIALAGFVIAWGFIISFWQGWRPWNKETWQQPRVWFRK